MQWRGWQGEPSAKVPVSPVVVPGGGWSLDVVLVPPEHWQQVALRKDVACSPPPRLKPRTHALRASALVAVCGTEK